jgi:hypothetical protein
MIARFTATTRRYAGIAGLLAAALAAGCGRDATAVSAPQHEGGTSALIAAPAGVNRTLGPGTCNDCHTGWIIDPGSTQPASLVGSISGPGSHRPNQTCQFQAVVSGGTPPYTYSWTGAGQSGSEEFFYPNSAGITYSYTVSLHITDAAGQSGQVSMTVLVGTQYRYCAE